MNNDISENFNSLNRYIKSYLVFVFKSKSHKFFFTKFCLSILKFHFNIPSGIHYLSTKLMRVSNFKICEVDVPYLLGYLY